MRRRSPQHSAHWCAPNLVRLLRCARCSSDRWISRRSTGSTAPSTSARIGRCGSASIGLRGHPRFGGVDLEDEETNLGRRRGLAQRKRSHGEVGLRRARSVTGSLDDVVGAKQLTACATSLPIFQQATEPARRHRAGTGRSSSPPKSRGTPSRRPCS